MQVTARRGDVCAKKATPTMEWEIGGSMARLDAVDAGGKGSGDGGGSITYSQLVSVGVPGFCLSSGPTVQYAMDPWCAKNNNMWRSSTDTLQVWSRVLVEIDSLVGLGSISGPGHWGFADSLEIGVPGDGVLTWEESKSHLALYAVTSQPLFLSNDLRPGYVQPRLLGLFMNKDMLKVNQNFLNFAGDRMWTGAVGKEVWAKPLPEGEVGVVVFNRNGTTSQCNILAPHDSFAAPCDDNATESSGAQQIKLEFGMLPREWMLGGDGRGKIGAGGSSSSSGGGAAADVGGSTITCSVRDIFSGPTAAASEDLGKFSGEFDAGVLPPHGVRFVLLSSCSAAALRH
jgi:hypothetical protein